MSTDGLIEQRITQLGEVLERRQILLRELYHMMRRKDFIGHCFTMNVNDETDHGFGKFLSKFDLEKNPNATIESLNERDVVPISLPPPGLPTRYQPRRGQRSPSPSPIPTPPTKRQPKRSIHPKNTLGTSTPPRSPSPASPAFPIRTYGHSSRSRGVLSSLPRSRSAGIESKINTFSREQSWEHVRSSRASTSRHYHQQQQDSAAESADELDLIGSPSNSTRGSHSVSYSEKAQTGSLNEGGGEEEEEAVFTDGGAEKDESEESEEVDTNKESEPQETVPVPDQESISEQQPASTDDKIEEKIDEDDIEVIEVSDAEVKKFQDIPVRPKDEDDIIVDDSVTLEAPLELLKEAESTDEVIEIDTPRKAREQSLPPDPDEEAEGHIMSDATEDMDISAHPSSELGVELDGQEGQIEVDIENDNHQASDATVPMEIDSESPRADHQDSTSPVMHDNDDEKSEHPVLSQESLQPPVEIALDTHPVPSQLNAEAPAAAGGTEPDAISVDDNMSLASVDDDAPNEAKVSAEDSAPSAEIQQPVPTISPEVLMTPKHDPVIIPAPLSSLHSFSPFKFDPESVASSSVPTSPTHSRRHQFVPGYTLPPLKLLTAEFNRKARPSKLQRKKDKEREKNEGKKDKDKDDWVPLGSQRWLISIRVNPAYKKLSRATKCVSTRDWGIAMTEMRYLRAMDRIDNLKDNGRWSYKQPKKQRNVGMQGKTHWDYLMDEMKWMRTDFREERKWKLALAYNLSTAVLEWHAAGTPEARIVNGICVLWKRPREDSVLEIGDDTIMNGQETPEDMDIDVDLDADGAQSNVDGRLSSLALGDYGSEDEDEDEPEKSIIDPHDTATNVQQVVQDLEFQSDITKQEPEDVPMDLEPKKEELEHPEALKLPENDEVILDVPNGQTKEQSEATTALKEGASNPVLSSVEELEKSNTQSTDGDREVTNTVVKSKSAKAIMYAPLREQIVYSALEKLFLEPDDCRIKPSSDLPDATPSAGILPPPDVNSIFPDLQPLVFIEPPSSRPSPSPNSEGKKKSDKRADKDDLHKRVDDTLQTKIWPATQFMYTKPTLVGALNPAVRWKDGKWTSMDNSAISADLDAHPKVSEDSHSNLFEQKNVSPLRTQKEKDRKPCNHLWTPSEDLLLKTFIDRYPYNWELIAESLNGTRRAIVTDKRTAQECHERWKEKWPPADSKLKISDSSSAAEGTPPPATPGSNQILTRGVKRMASVTAPMEPSPGALESDNKKRRRHAVVQEGMRRAAKRRADAALRNSGVRKTSGTHETHNQYNKMARLTPAELSRMKSERELRDSQANQELQMRARQNEAARQNRGAPSPSPAAQAAGASAASTVQPPNAQPRPAPVQVPPQAVPIRSQVNISQQQRIGTPLVPGATRLSPQQLLQVRAAQQQQLSQALAQVQAQNAAAGGGQAVPTNMTSNFVNNAVNGVSGVPAVMSNAHMAGQNYIARDATSSPSVSHGSPPRNTATPSNAMNPPRPPSAQAQMQSQLQNALARAPYYLPNVSTYTQEQIQNVLRLQMQVQQAQQQQQNQPAQPPNFPQS